MPANPRIRADSARIIDVQTEGDLVVLRSHLARQDDSGRFRLWEVAGGSHADEHTLNPKNPPVASVAGSPCEFRMNSARTHFVVGAAVHALDRWTRGLGAPGRARRLRLTPDAETAPDPIVRDRDGLARGGIRLPQIDVPTARVDGLVNPAAPGAPDLFVAFCGSSVARSRSTGRRSTPAIRVASTTRSTVYWYAVVDANRGFLNQEDPPQLLWEAATSDIGA